MNKVYEQPVSNKAEIVCIIDKSGSMGMLRNDAIGGFNTFLKDQKAIPGEANLTLVLFDTTYKVLHESKPLQEVEDLTEETYVPSGGTALHETIIKTIESIDKIQEKNPTSKVLFSILTDGEENSSAKGFTKALVSEMITDRTDKKGWDFLFLAANQSAFEEGSQLGIHGKNTYQFANTGEGTQSAYSAMSKSMEMNRIGGLGNLKTFDLSKAEGNQDTK